MLEAPILDWLHSLFQMAFGSTQLFCHRSFSGQTDRQTDRWSRQMVSKNTVYSRYTDRDQRVNNKTSHMARCVMFAVARIRVKGLPLEIGEILHIFPSGTESMGDRGSKRAYMGPRTKCGCDRSIVVGCRSRNDRQTSRQSNRMEWQGSLSANVTQYSTSTINHFMQQWGQTIRKTTQIHERMSNYS